MLDSYSAKGNELESRFCPPSLVLPPAAPILSRRGPWCGARGGLDASQEVAAALPQGWGHMYKLSLVLFSEEVLSVNRACGRVCPGQR